MPWVHDRLLGGDARRRGPDDVASVLPLHCAPSPTVLSVGDAADMFFVQPPSPRPLVACACFLLAAVRARLDDETSPTSVFRSRPDLHAPRISLEILYPELVSPGYLFLAPYRNVEPGPYIYDNYGQLVWSGAGSQGASTAHNPHVCEYNGKDHLCFFQGHQHHGWARGHGVIMDNQYRVVRTVEAVGAATQTDMHEFRLINRGRTALVTIYQPRAYDLGAFGVGPGLAWIQDSVFQEIDVETGELLFEWRALDHIAPSFSYTCIDCTDTSGNGLSRDTPWDYFHINSIDKNEEGDYLISARHVAAVYKISSQDGRVLWELNGANPTFKNENLHFSSQHHALWVHENQTHTIISLFDNASNTFNITNKESRGMLIAINHVKRTATKLQEWLAPEEEGILSGSQGNMQRLPDGNVFIGWGDHAFYSEHLDSGEAVLYGKLAYWGSDVMMYRCNKYPWIGEPLTTPSLWTYSKTGNNDSSLAFFVSWNGATEVRAWNFYTADSASGPWQLAGRVNRTGFETEYRAPFASEWSFAEALDKSGKPLKRSGIAKTFVPSESMAPLCDEGGCDPIPPLPKGEVFDQTMPMVTNRGKFYTQGYDTARYYPINAGLFAGVPRAHLALPFVLILFIISAVCVAVGRRRIVRVVSSFQEWATPRAFHLCGGEAYGDQAIFSPGYRKLEGPDALP